MSFFGGLVGGFIGSSLGSSSTKEVIHEVQQIERKGIVGSKLYYFEIPKDIFDKKFEDYEPEQDEFYSIMDIGEEEKVYYLTIKIENNVDCLSSIILLRKITEYLRTHNNRSSQAKAKKN